MAELSQTPLFTVANFNDLFIVKHQKDIKEKLSNQNKKYPMVCHNLKEPEFYAENVVLNHYHKLIKIDSELEEHWQNENYEFVYYNLNRLFKVDMENKLKTNKLIDPSIKQKSPNYCPNFHKLNENQIMLRDLKIGGNRIIGKYAISKDFNLLGSYDEKTNSITMFSQCFNPSFKLHNGSIPVQLNISNIRNYPGYILMNETANEYINECCDHNDNNVFNFMYSNLNNISISDNNRNRISAKTGYAEMEEKAKLYRQFCNTQIKLYKKWLNKEFIIVDENLNKIDVKLNEIKFKDIDEIKYPKKDCFDPRTNFIHEVAYINYELFRSHKLDFVDLDETNCPIAQQPDEINDKIKETFGKRKYTIMRKVNNKKPSKSVVFNKTLSYSQLIIDSKNKPEIQEITDSLYDKFYNDLSEIIKEFILEYKNTNKKSNKQTRYDEFLKQKPVFEDIVTIQMF